VALCTFFAFLVVSCVKPKFRYADFHKNFPVGKIEDTNHERRLLKWWQIMKSRKFRWKLLTQITKVANTNHLDMLRCLRQSPWQVCYKPVCVALMEFSLLQCMRKVDDKVLTRTKFPTKLRTCRGHKSWKSATWFVSRTIVICVHDKFATLSGTCRELCCKVGVMEFGL